MGSVDPELSAFANGFSNWPPSLPEDQWATELGRLGGTLQTSEKTAVSVVELELLLAACCHSY